jgi:uncharacterized protein YjaG (DUF416 family)
MAEMKAVLEYDEKRLVNELNRLAPARRAAFAASCAERLAPMYRTFSKFTGEGEPEAIAAALEHVWEELSSENRNDARTEEVLAACEKLVTDEDAGERKWVVQRGCAQNALAAVIYTVRCLRTGDAQEAAWSARQAYEALDLHVQHLEDFNPDSPDAEERLLMHPLVQVELGRQRHDLLDLQEGFGLARLRDRARRDSARLFG